jgi:hypothetical protein
MPVKRQFEQLDRDVLGGIQRARFQQTINAKRQYFGTSLPKLIEPLTNEDDDVQEIKVVVNLSPPAPTAPCVAENERPGQDMENDENNAAASAGTDNMPTDTSVNPNATTSPFAPGGSAVPMIGGGGEGGGYVAPVNTAQPPTPSLVAQAKEEVAAAQVVADAEKIAIEKQKQEDKLKMSKEDFMAKYNITPESYDIENKVFKEVDFSFVYVSITKALGSGQKNFKGFTTYFGFPDGFDLTTSDIGLKVTDLTHLEQQQTQNKTNVYDKADVVIKEINTLITSSTDYSYYFKEVPLLEPMNPQGCHVDKGIDAYNMLGKVNKNYTDGKLFNFYGLPNKRKQFTNLLKSGWDKYLAAAFDTVTNVKNQDLNTALTTVINYNQAISVVNSLWNSAARMVSGRGVRTAGNEQNPPTLSIESSWKALSNTPAPPMVTEVARPPETVPSVPATTDNANENTPSVPATTDNANENAPPPGAKDQPIGISNELDLVKYQTQPIAPAGIINPDPLPSTIQEQTHTEKVPMIHAAVRGTESGGASTGLGRAVNVANNTGLTPAQSQQQAVTTQANTAVNSAPTNEAAPKIEMPTPFTGMNPSAAGMVSRTGQGGPSPNLPVTARTSIQSAEPSLVNNALKDLLAKILMQHSPVERPKVGENVGVTT